jgi:thymidylate kinase
MNKRNLFIIIEGPDNVGKSTLIQNLKNKFNNFTLHALHYSNVKQESPAKTIEYSTKMYTEMFQNMFECSKYDKSGMIFDRSHLGEMVYGPIYRGYTGEYVLDVERKFKHIHPIWDNLYLITLIDQPDNLIMRDDGLSFSTDKEKKKTEINNFINAHDKSLIKNKLLINIVHSDAEKVSERVTHFINHTY